MTTSEHGNESTVTMVPAFAPIICRPSEDEETQRLKEKWNRCLDLAVKTMNADHGTELEVESTTSGRTTRNNSKSSFSKATEAYEELRNHLEQDLGLDEDEQKIYKKEMELLDGTYKGLLELRSGYVM